MTTDPFGAPGDPFGSPGRASSTRDRGDAEERARVPRDSYGRYRLPDLRGKMPPANQGATRVSTLKSALSDTFGIQDHNQRLTAEGIATNPDLTAAVAKVATDESLSEADRKKRIRKLAEEAFRRAGGKVRADLGTAFHELTEDINAGKLPDVPEESKTSVGAYVELLEKYNVRTLPQWLEITVRGPFGTMGTFDNLVEWWNPDTEMWELVIADLKTGRDLEKGWLEIFIQLWCYVNASHYWTTTELIKDASGKIVDIKGFWLEMPRDLRRDKALIIHVPLDGSAKLELLDLAGVDVWAAAAITALRANIEAKHKVRRLGSVEPAAFVVPQPDAVITGTSTGPLAVHFPTAQQAEPMDVPGHSTGPKLAAGSPVYFTAHTGDPGPNGSDNVSTTHVVPTAQQLADADLAAERLAKMKESASALAQPATADREPTGLAPEERDPVTGRKKRTCGFCRKPGHTQKNCPENPESPKYVGPDVDPNPMPLPGDPTADGPLAEDQPLAHPGWDGPASTVPYCDDSGHRSQGFTATHPSAPGQWVCVVDGKPAREAWERSQTLVTLTPPAYGHPTGAAQAPEQVAEIGRTMAHLGPSPWLALEPSPWDALLSQIGQATDPGHLLGIRNNAIAAGTWSDELDQVASAKYTRLIS